MIGKTANHGNMAASSINTTTRITDTHGTLKPAILRGELFVRSLPWHDKAPVDRGLGVAC